MRRGDWLLGVRSAVSARGRRIPIAILAIAAWLLPVRTAAADGPWVYHKVPGAPASSSANGASGSYRSTPRPPPPPVYSSAATCAPGCTTADRLAAKAGLTYQDGGSFVLLSSADSRVRLYPGTNRISIDGEEITLRGRIVRNGMSIVVPGPAADMIEKRVRSERGRVASLRAANAPPLAAASKPAVPGPARPRATPTPAKSRGGSARPGPEGGWVPVGVSERPWKWIVLHHSDDHSGNAAKYHAQHLGQGWENGLGYHFVIGNGTMSSDGETEVGSRWSRQIQGAHAKTDDNCYNDFGIGIVLVGDFEHGTGRPSAAQMTALVRLCRFLMERYGISIANVKGHCDCKPTACPGKNFPWAELRARLASGY